MVDRQSELPEPDPGEERRRIKDLSEPIKPITTDFARLKRIKAELGELYRAVIVVQRG